MDSYRSSLEVMKWMEPKQVLSEYSHVCQAWTRACQSDELWIQYFETESVPALPSCGSFKSGYQHLHCSPYSLFLLSKQYLEVFNVRKHAWVRKTKLQQRMLTDTTSAFVVLPDGSLLISGGGDPILSASFQVDLLGKITNLASMTKKRAEHGIVVHNSAVYVFGGERDTGLMRASEKLEWEYLSHIRDSAWASIGKMKTKRKLFKPCVHGDGIYLFGGYASTSEVYSPVNGQFTPLNVYVNGDSCESLTVLNQNALYVFLSSECLVLSLDNLTALASHHCSKLATIWGKRNGILYKEKVYFTFNNLIHRYDTKTAKLSRVAK